MKYFYAYATTEAECEAIHTIVLHSDLNIQETSIYIDNNRYDAWNQLIANLEMKDELYVYKLSSIAADGNTLFVHLTYIKNKNITIKLLDDSDLNTEQMLTLIDFVREHSASRYMISKWRESRELWRKSETGRVITVDLK